ncbi:MAG: alpha/beta fold hydrolase [Thermomicrobiales bacterium]
MTNSAHQGFAKHRLTRRGAVRAGGLGAAAALGGVTAPRTLAQAATPVVGQAMDTLRPLLSDNPMWEAFGNRALVLAIDRGADFGECMTSVHRVGAGGVDDWYREWVATADRVAAIGDDSAAAGHRISAREAWFRACNYYRSAYFPLYGAPIDSRLVEAFDKETTVFLKGAALSDIPIEAVEIPFEGKSLPGYLVTSDDSGEPRPTIVHTNGYDSTIQEMYFAHAPAAIRRGYNVLLFDGPGQGRNLIKDGIHIRPDWENVVRPVIDYALTRPEIDPDRIALAGWSFGGFLAPRAAAFEHRLAALIADPGQWDEGPAILARLPLTDEQKAAFPDIDPALLAPFEAWLQSPEAPAMLRWALIQRGFWVNGVDSVYAYAVDMFRYELSSVAKDIACPTFLSWAQADPVADYAPKLYEAITAPKVLVPFTMAEGAGMHTESLARTLYDQRMFDWLDETLGMNG